MDARITAFVLALMTACSGAPRRASTDDLILHGGTVYVGSGGEGSVADIAVDGDRIVALGDLRGARARREIDAHGMAVSPSLEVFGEGLSFGPLTDAMKREVVSRQHDFKHDGVWTTLGEYLDFLTARGVSPNVASFVGATTLRMHVIGEPDRAIGVRDVFVNGAQVLRTGEHTGAKPGRVLRGPRLRGVHK